MEKHGIVLVMNIEEKELKKILGFLRLFLMGNEFIEGITIRKHNTMKFFMINFDPLPDFNQLKLVIHFLKNSRSIKVVPDIRGFWNVSPNDAQFPNELHGKNLMVYIPEKVDNLNSVYATSSDQVHYTMSIANNNVIKGVPRSEKDYLQIKISEEDFDPVEFKPVDITSSFGMPKFVRIGLVALFVFLIIVIAVFLIINTH